MKSKWRLFFSLRRLPPELADIDRLTLRSAMIAMVVLPPFLFPGRHFFLYPICGMLIAYIGRLVGFVRHYPKIGQSSQPGPRRDNKTTGILLAIAAAVLLTATLYSAWTTHDPIYLTQSFFGAAVLTYSIGRIWAPVAMGLVSVFLLIGALILYFHFLLTGFLAGAAFAGLLVWHFLFRNLRSATPGQISESTGS